MTTDYPYGCLGCQRCEMPETKMVTLKTTGQQVCDTCETFMIESAAQWAYTEAQKLPRTQRASFILDVGLKPWVLKGKEAAESFKWFYKKIASLS